MLFSNAPCYNFLITGDEEAQAADLPIQIRGKGLGEWKMKLVSQEGRVAIWEVIEGYGSDFYVYDGAKLVRVCPSIGMAREVVAGL